MVQSSYMDANIGGTKEKSLSNSGELRNFLPIGALVEVEAWCVSGGLVLV